MNALASGIVASANIRYGVPRLEMLGINAPIPVELMSTVLPDAVREMGTDVFIGQEAGRQQVPHLKRATGLKYGAFAAMFNINRPPAGDNSLGLVVLSRFPILETRRRTIGLFDGEFPNNWDGAGRGRPQTCVLLMAKIRVPWLKQPGWFASHHFMMSRRLGFTPIHHSGIEQLVHATGSIKPLLLGMDANQGRDEVRDEVLQPGQAWSILTDQGNFNDFVPRTVKTTFDPSSPGGQAGLEAVIDWLLGRGFPRPVSVQQVFGVSDHSLYKAQFPA